VAGRPWKQTPGEAVADEGAGRIVQRVRIRFVVAVGDGRAAEVGEPQLVVDHPVVVGGGGGTGPNGNDNRR